jgi:lipoteichoic acid synthase
MLKMQTLYPAVSKLPERVLLSSLLHTNGLFYPAGLSPATTEKLKTFGIFIDPKRKYPLYKEHTFYESIPYAKILPTAEKPNVIVFLMESLSARLLGIYGNRYENVTPHIDSFAKEALMVGPFFNSSTITVNGVTASLCSHYPSADRAWGSNDDCLICLPEILQKSKYHTYAIMNDRSMKLSWLRNYVQTFEEEEIKESLKEGPKGAIKTVISDKQVFKYVNKQLGDRTLQEPFLMTVYTMDLHPPFHMPQDGVKYGDGKNILLNLVFNLDEAFGTFWEYFRKSSYAHNTILVFTADHAMYPWVDYRKYFYGVDAVREYDEIPLIVYDPTHRLPHHLNVTSTQVDIVPSLLHLLNIDIPNPFEGHSVFGEMGRKRYPNILGSHPNIFFYRQNNENKVFRRGDYTCKGNENLANNTFTPCDYIEWLQYNEFLVKNNLIWDRKNPDVRVPW